MRKILALIPIGVFGLAGYAIAFRAIPPGGLAATLDEIARTIGPGLAGALVLCVGIFLSWLISRSLEQKAQKD